MRYPLAVVLTQASLLLAAAGVPARGQGTERISLDSSGGEGDDDSWGWCGLSTDGRFVVFSSRADDLVPYDTNLSLDVFVRDRLLGTTERVSVGASGTEGNGDSWGWAISDDGRYVAFESVSDDFVANDNNHLSDIFVRDRSAGTTERISVDPNGNDSNVGPSYYASMSADGRYVVFTSMATNLVAGDVNAKTDVFVRDRQSATTQLVSVDSAGNQGNDDSRFTRADISADGRWVAFASLATNLVSGDTNRTSDIFLRDLQNQTTERVSVDTAGTEGNAWSEDPVLSGDGRFVAFASDATNLVNGDGNRKKDVFVRDRQAVTTRRISVDSAGVEGNDASGGPSITRSGRFVAFASSATNLVSGDTNARTDLFLHDRHAKTTTRASVDATGAQADGDTGGADFSPDGRFLGFASQAKNLVPGDTNGATDVFVHGPWLTLVAEPVVAYPGTTLTFSTWQGLAGGVTLLVVTDLNGTPTFVPAVSGSFDGVGAWTFSASVPLGLAGNVISFSTFGIVPTGKVDASEPFAISFL